MEHKKLSEFTRGWFIGNFSPSLYPSKDFEVGIKQYQPGDSEVSHFHKVVTEYTTIVSGKFEINGHSYQTGDIIIFYPGEVANFRCICAGQTVVVKHPSLPEDKYTQEVSENET